MRVPPEMVLPVFVSVIFFIALLIGYPWHILSAGSVLYLASLPLGWKSYKDHERARGGCSAGQRPRLPRQSHPPRSRAVIAAPAAESPSDDRPDRTDRPAMRSIERTEIRFTLRVPGMTSMPISALRHAELGSRPNSAIGEG